MPSSYPRRDVLGVCGTGLCLGIAGCIGDSSTVSSEDAKERALSAEKAFITETFQFAPCVTEWGTDEVVTNTEAEVTKRTSDGVHVELTHAYWFATEEMEWDGGLTATYVVTTDTVQRINGESITPCQW